MFFALIFLSAKVGLAEEVDDFVMDRTTMPPSASALIDRMVNDQLKKFIKDFNKPDLTEPRSCDHKYLVKSLLYNLDQNFSEVGNKLRQASDYQASDGTINATYPIKFFGRAKTQGSILEGAISSRWMVQLVNLDGIPVGIDKIDHMFGNGGLLWEVYEEDRAKGTADVNKVLRLSENQENGGWGLGGSGVKSYGDLAANWAGFNFYRELIDGPNPYLVCKDNKLMLKRAFHIAQYTNKAWTESSNCSSYASREILERVMKNLEKKGITCPMRQEDCDEIVAIYKENPTALQTLVSPVCRGRKLEDSVEQASDLDWTVVKQGLGGLGSMIQNKAKGEIRGWFERLLPQKSVK